MYKQYFGAMSCCYFVVVVVVICLLLLQPGSISIQLLEREVEVLKRVNHPSIIQLEAVYETAKVTKIEKRQHDPIMLEMAKSIR